MGLVLIKTVSCLSAPQPSYPETETPNPSQAPKTFSKRIVSAAKENLEQRVRNEGDHEQDRKLSILQSSQLEMMTRTTTKNNNSNDANYNDNLCLSRK